MGSINDNDIKEIEKILSSCSKGQLDDSVEASILKSKKLDNCEFLNLSLYLANKECDQFIINVNSFKPINRNIKIKLRDLKLKMIDNINYLEIKKFSDSNGNLIVPKDRKAYSFNLPKNDLNIKNDSSNVVSIKLKAKEIDMITSFKYEFFDLYNNKIKFDSVTNFSNDLFENDKIYFFNGFYFDKNKNTIHETNFSSIEVVDENTMIENNYYPNDLNDIKIGEITNLKGFIKDLNMLEFSVSIEELISHEKMKIKLNYDLVKKINPNRECKFINLKKVDYKIYEWTQLTDIFSSEETTIQLKIYDIQDKYYNRININNSDYFDITDNKIKDNIFEFNINSKDKSLLFEQKFIFEKTRKIENNNNNNPKNENNINNIIVEDSYEFNLEVNKGRINKFPGFLKKKGGYTYQLHFQTKKDNLLPEKVKIKIANDNFMEIDDFESFDNKLKKRITIINAVKQDFIDINYKNKPFRLNEAEFIDTEKSKNLKIYNIIKEKEENKIFEKAVINKDDNRVFCFELTGKDNNKEYFRIKDEDKEEINQLFKNILNEKHESNKDEKDKIGKILEEKNYKDFFEKGLTKYIFHNSKEDYIIMKQLLILYFYNKMPKKKFNLYIYHFKDIFPIVSKGDYLTRIKILIYYYHYNEEKYLFENLIIDIYDEKNNDYENYKPFFDAFKLFFNIMDNQREECPFYQGIHQFNGKIRTEMIMDLKIYSGSIISLKDIKFELIKGINRFLIVDIKSKSSSIAFFSLKSEIITFNLKSFMNKIDFTNIEKRLTSVFLFLIFHEICGHFKTNINNQLENSPSYHLDENLNLIFTLFGIHDSGFIFESLLTGNIISCRKLILDKKSEDLLDIKLYTQDNFNDLKKKIDEFNPKITTINPKFRYDDKKKPANSDDDRESNYDEIKELPEELKIKLKEAEKDLDNSTYHSLFPLFKIPNGMTADEFKNILKNNVVYQKFMKLQPGEGEKY